MGYDLHITRKDCWAEEEDNRCISAEEWKAYADSDPELTKDLESSDENDYIFVRQAGNWPLWFNSRLGNIYTKNPDIDVIQKMVNISLALKAKVQGDDQEFYDFTGEPYREPSMSAPVHSEMRYLKYFMFFVFICSIIWHIFNP